MRAEPEPRLRASAAFVAGVSAMLLATGLLGLASLVQASVSFPPLGLAQRFLHLIPGRVDVFFIDLMGHWALRSFAAGFTVGSILAGGVAGILVARVPGPGSGRTAAIWGAATVLAALAFAGWSSAPGGPSALTYAALVGAAGAVFALALGGALGRLERDVVPPPARGLGRSRREFLRAAVGAGGLVVAGLAVRRFSGGAIGGDRGGKPLARPAGAAPVKAATPAPADAADDRAFLSIPGLTPEVTPNRLHYVVDESIIDPNVDSGSWRLRVDGLVGEPLTLTYQDLLAMPAIEQYVTLQCISNLVGGDLVSTAKWTVVPLKAVLARAGGVAPGAVRVVFHAVGGYTDSLPVAKALDGETVGGLWHERPEPAARPRLPGADRGAWYLWDEMRQVAATHRSGQLRLSRLLAARRGLGQHRHHQVRQPHRRPPRPRRRQGRADGRRPGLGGGPGHRPGRGVVRRRHHLDARDPAPRAGQGRLAAVAPALAAQRRRQDGAQGPRGRRAGPAPERRRGPALPKRRHRLPADRGHHQHLAGT